MISPAASSLRNSSQLAQSGTRLEFAISTRGACSWVSNTADRLARLDEQRLLVAQSLKLGHDRVIARPVARGLADPAVDDELGGILGHVGVQVVLEHAQGRFLLPALAAQRGCAHAALTSGAPMLRENVAAWRATARPHASTRRDVIR